LTPSKPARFEAALLESFAAAAGAEIVPTELLLEQFLAMDHAQAGLNLRLRRVSLATLAHRLKKTIHG
jgi:hypothetical protein